MSDSLTPRPQADNAANTGQGGPVEGAAVASAPLNSLQFPALPSAEPVRAKDRADGLAGSQPNAGSVPASAIVIVVCETCRQADELAPDAASDLAAAPRAGAVLATETERMAAGSAFTVRRVSCMSNCKRGLSAAILSDSAWTYVFGNLKPTSAPDLLHGAALLAASTDGLMPFRPRPESLKRGMIARIPNMQTLFSSPAPSLPPAKDLP